MGGVTEAIGTIGTGRVIASAGSLLTATTPETDAGMVADLAGGASAIESGGTVISGMATMFATADIEVMTTLAIGGGDIGKRITEPSAVAPDPSVYFGDKTWAHHTLYQG